MNLFQLGTYLHFQEGDERWSLLSFCQFSGYICGVALATVGFFFFSLFFFLIPDFFSLVSEHIKQHKLGIARFLGWVKEWLDCLEHTRAWSLEPCLCLHTFSCDISTLSFAQFLVLLNTSIIFTC